METRENNLKVYLKGQMEEYKQECESIKALYADLLEHIEECRDQIRRQKEQEDPGFALLSPLGERLQANTSSARLEGQIEAYEKQKGKYLQQIRFYEDKVTEMQAQLEEFARNEALKAQWEEKLHAEQAQAAAAKITAADAAATAVMQSSEQGDVPEKDVNASVATDNTHASGRTENDGMQPEKKDAVSEERLTAAVRDAVNEAVSRDRARYAETWAYFSRKLAEIKEYVQLDPMRCRVELDRLMQYMEQMKEE